MRKILPPLAACALIATPAGAQLIGGGLVVVNVSNVANNVAQNLSVDFSRIPVTVQVPVGIAATACDVSANVLAKQMKDGGASCTAESTSTGLSQVVGRNLLPAG